MCIAAAIVGAAVVGAGATVYASDQAASATQNAANQASAAQRAALAQGAQLAAPYTGLGQDAMAQYRALLGIAQQPTAPGARAGPARRGGYDPSSGFRVGPGGQITQEIPGGTSGSGAQSGGANIEQTLSSLPGYQFAKQQGLQAVNAQAAAQGLGLSGNQLQALDQFSTGLADQTYGEQLNRLLAPIQIGQAAAAGQAANIQTGASNLGNIAIGQGANLAGIYANETAGLMRAIGNAGNQYLTYNTLKNLGGGGGDLSGLNYAGAQGGALDTMNIGGDFTAPTYSDIYGG